MARLKDGLERWEAGEGSSVFQLAWSVLHASAAVLAALAVVGHTASAVYHARRI